MQRPASPVSHTLEDVLKAQKYEMLNAFLLKTYSLYPLEWVERVLAIPDLGDRCSWSLLNFMLTIVGDCGLDDFLRQLFLRALPTFVQEALAGSDKTDFEHLADRADFIMSRPCRPAPPVCNVSSSLEYLLADRFACVDSPMEDLPNVNSVFGHGFRPPQPRLQEHLCHCHRRFGLAAHQCRPHVPGGKKTYPQPPAVLGIQGADSYVLQIRDDSSRLTYCINTGVEVSILPASCLPRPPAGPPSSSTPRLFAANGTPINTFGVYTHTLHLGRHRFATRPSHQRSFPPVGGGLPSPPSASCGCHGAMFGPALPHVLHSLCLDELTFFSWKNRGVQETPPERVMKQFSGSGGR